MLVELPGAAYSVPATLLGAVVGVALGSSFARKLADAMSWLEPSGRL